MEASAADTVRIASRRMVRPSYGAMPVPPSEDIHLTPWDLFSLSMQHIQQGVLLPKPPAADAGAEGLVDTLASSLASALGRYYHFAGRLAIQEQGQEGTVAVTLRCTGEGAELVHAVAPGVAVADVVAGRLSAHTPSPVVEAFFPLNGVYCGDAAIDSSLPVLGVQVTELVDGVFIAMSMNHIVGDGTCFWELFNLWSAINHQGGGGRGERKPPVPVSHRRWFVDTSPLPIPLPFSTLQHVVIQRRRDNLEENQPPQLHGFFAFSAASVKRLKTKANNEMLLEATATISSLQALVAHLWRAVARARRLPPGQETSCAMIIGCRGRMCDIPPGYVGNAIGRVVTTAGCCNVGDILDKGLGWTAWQLNRVVASFDEVGMRRWLDRWAHKPSFFSGPSSSGGAPGTLVITSSPRFDVFGNDFGWGKPPVGMWSGPADKEDGKVSAFEGPEREGSISLEVSLTPETMERLVADQEFMEVVAVPAASG